MDTDGTAAGGWEEIIRGLIARATELVERHPQARIACLGLAFKANIDDFRESPARLVAATLARRFGDRIAVVEPYAAELPREFEGTGAALVDLDAALETCGVLIVLVDHDLFRSVPLAERAVLLIQIDAVTTQFGDADVECDPGTQGGLLEQGDHALARQGLAVFLRIGLDRFAEGDQRLNLCLAQVAVFQKMLHRMFLFPARVRG